MQYNNEFFTKAAITIAAYERYEAPDTWDHGHKRFHETYDTVMCFKGKADYLAWVAAWKACYAMLTADVREARKAYRVAVKQGLLPVYAKYNRNHRYGMMRIRMDAKRLSWQQKQAGQVSETCTQTSDKPAEEPIELQRAKLRRLVQRVRALGR